VGKNPLFSFALKIQSECTQVSRFFRSFTREVVTNQYTREKFEIIFRNLSSASFIAVIQTKNKLKMRKNLGDLIYKNHELQEIFPHEISRAHAVEKNTNAIILAIKEDSDSKLQKHCETLRLTCFGSLQASLQTLELPILFRRDGNVLMYNMLYVAAAYKSQKIIAYLFENYPKMASIMAKKEFYGKYAWQESDGDTQDLLKRLKTEEFDVVYNEEILKVRDASIYNDLPKLFFDKRTKRLDRQSLIRLQAELMNRLDKPSCFELKYLDKNKIELHYKAQDEWVRLTHVPAITDKLNALGNAALRGDAKYCEVKRVIVASALQRLGQLKKEPVLFPRCIKHAVAINVNFQRRDVLGVLREVFNTDKSRVPAKGKKRKTPQATAVEVRRKFKRFAKERLILSEKHVSCWQALQEEFARYVGRPLLKRSEGLAQLKCEIETFKGLRYARRAPRKDCAKAQTVGLQSAVVYGALIKE
jgi:hypothetical protein